MYELFEHTADLGLRARAPDLDGLFAEAAACLTAAVVEEPAAIREERRVAINVPGADPEFLLVDWLKRLLLIFEEERLVFRRFEVRVGPTGLSATAHGETYDPARHALCHEVKAVTYHELKVEQTADGWLAEVIVDI